MMSSFSNDHRRSQHSSITRLNPVMNNSSTIPKGQVHIPPLMRNLNLDMSNRLSIRRPLTDDSDSAYQVVTNRSYRRKLKKSIPNS